MTHYLELCNKVLRLMREDTVATLQAPDDVVVELVKDFVNDAKAMVEGAHDWNALRYEWTTPMVVSDPYVSLTGAGKSANISYIYRDDGVALQELPRHKMAALRAQVSPNATPSYYSVNGLDGNGDLRVLLHPTPSAATNLIVSGYKKQDALAGDLDELEIPFMPVVYMALAFALRERGEVGGQTAAEVLGMAKGYLSDAIANDVALNQYDYDWYVN